MPLHELPPRSYHSETGIHVYSKSIQGLELTKVDTLVGPVLICAALFIAILSNFVFRLQESHKHTGINPMSFQNAWYQAGLKSSWGGK